MSSLEDEIRDLREKNNELVLKVQYWKMTAAEREIEKLELMKEINDLRLKLSRLRNGGTMQARNLDAALQTASEEALTHLVQASDAVARTMELAKTYMRDRQELETLSPRWSNISGTPNMDRVHRVPPMMVGGQPIQPVVSLSRTAVNNNHINNARSATRSPNHNRSVSAVPMRMLQDVYIPLTRIDANEEPPGNIIETSINEDNADVESELGSNEYEADIPPSRFRMPLPIIKPENDDESGKLDAVTEDLEPQDGLMSPHRSEMDNPLEGPSWLLDRPRNVREMAVANEFSPTVRRRQRKRQRTLSFPQESNASPGALNSPGLNNSVALHTLTSCNTSAASRVSSLNSSAGIPPSPNSAALHEPFLSHSAAAPPSIPNSAALRTPPDSPTWPSSRPESTPPKSSQSMLRRASGSGGEGRVLKVMVAKMRLEEVSPRPAASRLLSLDAPSPNGFTSAAVVVSETSESEPLYGFGDCGASTSHDSRNTKSKDNRNTKSNYNRNTKSQENRGSKSNDSRNSKSHDSCDGDSHDDARTRRPRKPVTYKEKPLNRKMRR